MKSNHQDGNANLECAFHVLFTVAHFAFEAGINSKAIARSAYIVYMLYLNEKVICS